jgi:tetratricopeptide (TPR) repeat protein
MDFDIELQKAQQLANLGKNHEARSILRKLLKLDNKNEQAWILFSNVAEKKEHEIQCLQCVIKINPNNEQARLRLSQLFPNNINSVDTIISQHQPNIEIVEESFKRCPYCAEQIQRDAIICRYCGIELSTGNLQSQSPIPVQPELIQPTKKSSCTLPIAIVLTILVAICICVFASSMFSNNNNNDTPSGTLAYLMCQEFINDRLKAPASAKYPDVQDVTIKKIGETNRFVIIGYVDAENSFGANLRSRFTCEITYSGNDKWVLNDLSIE